MSVYCVKTITESRCLSKSARSRASRSNLLSVPIARRSARKSSTYCDLALEEDGLALGCLRCGEEKGLRHVGFEIVLVECRRRSSQGCVRPLQESSRRFRLCWMA